MSSLSDGRSAGFLWIDNVTLEHIGAEIGPYGIAVYAAIAMHTTGRGREAWPGAKRLAEIAGCSPRKVKSTLHDLEAAGVLQIKERTGDTSIFTILDAPTTPESDESGGVHDMHGGGARHARGGVHDVHPNNNHRTRTKTKRGGPAEKSPSESPSLTADAKPLADAFTASGAELTNKRIRILNRWAERGRIDDVQRFARVVEKDFLGVDKDRQLNMSVLLDKYREDTAKAAERATGGTVTDVHGRGDGAPQAVPHKTAVKVHHHIRNEINGKASLTEHFDHIGDGDWRPVTATAHSVLSSLSTDSTVQ
ncbi:hypothetical protein CRI93_14900 [Longimonas halophila]|uniref:Helix-turn-helix domain-containing protein n=1 Tax=Longimonas halophila TaxID=1469170 RepID=A0A2H3NWY7_9BACT|nr:helix-turn-helix domain-containing protein [Longimonas halophila]PEN04626.1 hypothetical protein CRI93_14900 [Longimonas halophila]